MFIKQLHLKNIGPFLDDTIDFNQVTFLTGENGTGKTVVLDAIRKMFLGIGWNIVDKIRTIRRSDDFLITMTLIDQGKEIYLHSKELNNSYQYENFEVLRENNSSSGFQYIFTDPRSSKGNIWVANYWTSQNDHSEFHISSLDFIKPENYLIGSLSGIQKNAETTKIVTFFDYYKSSDKPEEKKEGEFIFNVLKKIFEISLLEGEFIYVDRSKLLPVIKQNGIEVSLEKLSSGNLYLVQRLISLLGQMYSVYKLNDLPLEKMCNTSGVLLIDEAENHLHPKWQKTFIKSILDIFPNLQIIAATHSPFIVGSYSDAKVYVCKPENDHSVIIDETENYSNKPIEEILASDVFGETSSFADGKINKLLERRKIAIESGNKKEENEIEEELLKINPQYFSFLEIDSLLDKLKIDN